MSAEVDAAIDALTAQVKATTDIEAGAVLALNGFAARIDAAVAAALTANPGISPTQLAGITAETMAMKASADAVSAAIVANTPAATV